MQYAPMGVDPLYGHGYMAFLQYEGPKSETGHARVPVFVSNYDIMRNGGAALQQLIATQMEVAVMCMEDSLENGFRRIAMGKGGGDE